MDSFEQKTENKNAMFSIQRSCELGLEMSRRRKMSENGDIAELGLRIVVIA